jgi:acetolactate synthase-1/2/3 large subunit
MRGKDNTRSAAEVLVDALLVNGVRHAFCVPGESYLAVLDAFHDRDIAATVCRQEAGATLMAETVGKLTGRPGIAFVTRGPGATNGMHGIHIARQDSSPMIMFVGQVARDMREREAFQELAYRAVFGSVTKWATEIDDPARIPELVTRAFYTACNGRPGPVVIALPEDMLTERVALDDAPAALPVETAPGAAAMAELEKLLASAERPVMLLGGSRWSADAHAAICRFAERFALPTATTFRRMSHFDALNSAYAGDFGIGPNPKLLAYVKEADLVLAVGTRLSEMATQGYATFAIPSMQATFVHVHPSAEELGRVYRPDLAINATPSAFATVADTLKPPQTIRWRAQAQALHESFLAWTETPLPAPGPVNLGEIMVWLRGALPDDAIITNGAGNYATWVPRFYRFRQYNTSLGPTSGSMGYGFPAALAAKMLNPERTVVCFTGDGDFLMNGQELATAVQYDLPIITVLIDNGMLGTIRMHQEREYPGRISATTLQNPDFAAYARAFGAFGATVEKTADFAPAFEEARKSGRPALLHVKVDPEAITIASSITEIRERSLAAQRGG